jgi:hypothetical protein
MANPGSSSGVTSTAIPWGEAVAQGLVRTRRGASIRCRLYKGTMTIETMLFGTVLALVGGLIALSLDRRR